MEQFYTDEKHRQKTGADRLHHSLKDHESGNGIQYNRCVKYFYFAIKIFKLLFMQI